MLQYCIKQIYKNINKYNLHVLSIKLRYKLHFSFSIPTPGFPHFYYMLGANLGLLLYGEVSVMGNRFAENRIKNSNLLLSNASCKSNRSFFRDEKSLLL